MHAGAPLALVLLLPAPLAAYRQWRERKLLEGQKDLSSIRSLSWLRFETVVGEAYRRQGYAVTRSGGNGPDGGVDLVLRKGGNTLLVQCKQWKNWKVGVNVVREIYGVMTAEHASGAIVITSGIFTQEAKSFAAGKPIDLVEGQQLADLIRAVQVPSAQTPTTSHAASAAVRSPVQMIKDGPAQDVDPKKVCPKCGAEMVLRTAKRGPNLGHQFWGCSRFPECRATLPGEGQLSKLE